MMRCDICGRSTGHDPRCPKYIPEKAAHYCSICGDGIYDGERYIKNSNGEYIHYECTYTIKELLKWLGVEVKTMENTCEIYN
ncbi:MAG: DUF2175 domain-containing protein [Clostridium sp.]|nr:DUF2175 domain-containing protein [Clostridium sp.]